MGAAIVAFLIFFIISCFLIVVIFWVIGLVFSVVFWTIENFLAAGLTALAVWFLYKKVLKK